LKYQSAINLQKLSSFFERGGEKTKDSWRVSLYRLISLFF